jgi:ubiquinone/menaquinone biosynthesis C-methylase UbiE
MITEMTYSTEPASRDAVLRAGYDLEAEQYDAARYHSAEGRFFNDLEVHLLRVWLRPGPGDKVLDIPAGTGRLSAALAHGGATVIGTDISGNMLRVAASKRCGDELRRVQFAQGSGVQLPFADETFDAVVSFKFFHLVPNERKPDFVREMARVLKPGKTMVVEFNSPYYGGVLAAFRYYFRKKHPGDMRVKCIFPDQVGKLFEGLDVTRTYGVKLPLSGALSSIIGVPVTKALNLWFGRLPGLKYLAYTIMIEARKPARR